MFRFWNEPNPGIEFSELRQIDSIWVGFPHRLCGQPFLVLCASREQFIDAAIGRLQPR